MKDKSSKKDKKKGRSLEWYWFVFFVFLGEYDYLHDIIGLVKDIFLGKYLCVFI